MLNVTLPPDAACDEMCVPPVYGFTTFTADTGDSTAYVAVTRYDPALSVVYEALDSTGLLNLTGSAFTRSVNPLTRRPLLVFALSLKSPLPIC